MEDQESLSGSSSSSEPLQSAQDQPHILYSEDHELNLSDEDPSENPDSHGSTPEQAAARDIADSTVGNDVQTINAAAEEEHQGLPEPNAKEQASPPTRPNKFRGNPATWRNWTTPERDLMASLDQLTAQDLCVHLYNAFQLKRRANDQKRLQSTEANDDRESDERPAWKPPKVWTAWPLPPIYVPRDEGKRWEEEGMLGRQIPKKSRNPCDSLRELLEAQILRHAREQYSNRKSGTPPDEESSSGQSSPIEQAAKAPFDGRNDDSSGTLRPVVMADDERASHILRPTVTHILGKLDRLLMGLHRARSSYLEIDDSAFDSGSLKATPSRSRSRLGKRKRSASILSRKAALESQTASSSDADDQRTSRSRSRSRGRKLPTAESSRIRKNRLGLRAWSDVLGMASLTGWDADVVERTASRCALLFGEGITFRTLEEGIPGFTETSFVLNPQDSLLPDGLDSEEVIEDDHSSDIEESSDQMVGGVHVDGFLQKVKPKRSWKSLKGTSQRSTSRKAKV